MDATTAVAAAEGAKATGKFMDVLQNFFKPSLTKKQADADIYAIDQIVEAEKKYPDLDFTYQDGRISVRKLTDEELLERGKRRKLIESLKQERNLEQVIEFAANEVKNTESNVSDEPIDEDWLIRFFNIVEDVSSEDMQLVWSKILAGEVIQPGRFSLRTLETIRNVSKAEAEAFQKIIPLIMRSDDKYFITSDMNILEKYDIEYELFLRLSECGLLNLGNATILSHTITNKQPSIVFNDKKTILIFGADSTEVKISYGVSLLTKAGIELYSILKHDCNDGYVSDLAQIIYSQNKEKTKVSIHDLISHDGNKFQYVREPLQTFPA